MHYEKKKNGRNIIKDVPIFRTTMRKDFDYDFNDRWMEKAIEQMNKLSKQSFYAVVHKNHRPKDVKNPDDYVTNIGFAKNFRIKKLFDENNIICDFDEVDKEDIDSILSNQYPYRSVEINNPDSHQFSSIALLKATPPYYKLPVMSSDELKEQKPLHAFKEKEKFIFFEEIGTMTEKKPDVDGGASTEVENKVDDETKNESTDLTREQAQEYAEALGEAIARLTEEELRIYFEEPEDETEPEDKKPDEGVLDFEALGVMIVQSAVEKTVAALKPNLGKKDETENTEEETETEEAKKAPIGMQETEKKRLAFAEIKAKNSTRTTEYKKSGEAWTERDIKPVIDSVLAFAEVNDVKGIISTIEKFFPYKPSTQFNTLEFGEVLKDGIPKNMKNKPKVEELFARFSDPNNVAAAIVKNVINDEEKAFIKFYEEESKNIRF